MDEGPILAQLTRRLAETPAEFLAAPRSGRTGTVETPAVASDLLRALGGPPLSRKEADVMIKGCERARLELVLLASWLLHDPWFLARRELASKARALLLKGMKPEAAYLRSAQVIGTHEGREELVRVVLDALDLRPAGETRAQAEDRLDAVSTPERRRLIDDTAGVRKRLRQIRDAMLRKAAEVISTKVTGE